MWPVASEQASRENMRRGMVGLADEQQVHFQNLSDWIVDFKALKIEQRCQTCAPWDKAS